MSIHNATANLFDASAQNRVLAIGVFVSILVHVSLLVLFPGMRQSAPASAGPTVLTATLSSRVAAPPPKVAETPRPPEPEPRPQIKPPPEAPKPLLTRPDNSPAPATAPRVAEPPPPAPVQQATAAPTAPPAPANVPRAPEVQAPPASSGPPTAPRPVEGADTGNLDQYRVALLGAANRYKRYPAIAMEKGWAGKVEVRIVIGTNGMTQSIVVKTSSGFEVLDKTALDMVTKAKPMTPIPPALRGREFTLDIPVIFTLQTG
ncbi:MAG: energy transducer TonB [Burkholderiales bacterium]